VSCLLGGAFDRVWPGFQVKFNARKMIQRAFQESLDPGEPNLLEHLVAVAPKLVILDRRIEIGREEGGLRGHVAPQPFLPDRRIDLDIDVACGDLG
jgi:hypothetical protein